MTVTLTGATAKASGQIIVKEGKKTLATKALSQRQRDLQAAEARGGQAHPGHQLAR